MELSVRPATVDDADAIGHIHYQAWLETYTGLIDQTFLRSRSGERSAQRFRADGCRNKLAACADGTVVGFCHYNDLARDEDVPKSCGEIQAIYILQNYQGLSLGRMLLKGAESILTDQGCKWVCLWALAGNKKAIGFYEAMGYRSDGCEKTETLGNPVLLKRYLKAL